MVIFNWSVENCQKNLTKDEKVTTLSGVSGVKDVTLPEQKQKQKVTNRAKTA
ncbi:hypothetical protein NSMM_350044 [Nitrosomonas mobilis]|uniref:Uncharacterized protein n=1 Tax=Nitrosomonas mobilis TaxID=51642 RepID=A0A1G5SEA4_9PROT|nr:hypothetical protein NSMM_350044 [Nitrosomonas mobilis]